MAVNPLNSLLLRTPLAGFYPHQGPGKDNFSSLLNTLMEKPPTPEEVKTWASYLEWRLMAALFSLGIDNYPSPMSFFMTPFPLENVTPHDLNEVIAEAARENDLDPALIRAVIKAESGGNPKAVSPKGAMGLMQLMPETARNLGVQDPFDIRENVRAGARYLKTLIDRYQGNVELALAAYNWGPGNLERSHKSMPLETVQYIAKVKKFLGGTG